MAGKIQVGHQYITTGDVAAVFCHLPEGTVVIALEEVEHGAYGPRFKAETVEGTHLCYLLPSTVIAWDF